MKSVNAQADKPIAPHWQMLFFLYSVSIVLVYFSLHLNYRPNDVDDGWSLSFLYNYTNNGITIDSNFGDPMNGVQFFGKLRALLMGFVFNYLGWTRTNGHIISFLLMGIALVCWFFILRNLDHSIELSLSFVFTAFLLDPFFTAATSTRVEAFEFLLISMATASFLFQWYTVAMLVTWLAIETHPIGVIAFFYMFAVFFSFSPLRRSLINIKRSGLKKILIGFSLGAFGFYILHHEALGQLPFLLNQKNTPSDLRAYGPLFCYFFETKYYRHFPELALFGAALLLFFKKGYYQKEKFTLFFLIFLTVGAVLIRRPNFHYALFFYPALLILLLRTSEAMGQLKGLLVLLLFLLLPQYLYVYVKNHSFDFQKEIQTLRMTVPNDGRPVLGNGNEWFSFYNRPFYYYNYMSEYQKIGLTEFYLIEDNEYRLMNGSMKKWIELNFSETIITTVIINDQTYKIKKMRPNPLSSPMT